MMLKRLAIVALTGLTMTATPAMAQARYRSLVADSASKFQIAFCNLKTGGKVGDGQKAFRTGLEDKDAAKRAAALETALKVLQAEAAGAQAQSSGAWYYLARAYLAVGDVAGADSAFTRAQTLSPDCEVDITAYRQNSWAALATRGIQYQQAGQSDSAMYYFRGASALYQDLPHVFENMGVLFANADQSDSAAVYFGKAATVAERDTSLVDNRNTATLNYAIMLQRQGKYAEAIPVYKKLLGWAGAATTATEPVEVGTPAGVVERVLGAPTKVNYTTTAGGRSEQWVYPGDLFIYVEGGKVSAIQGTVTPVSSSGIDRNEVRKQLIGAYQGAGMADSAKAIEEEMVAEFSKMDPTKLSNAELMSVGVSMFNSQKYDEAGTVFGIAADRNPWSRDAVYNLANTQLALKQWGKLAETGKQLVAIEPLNEDSYRLMGQAYRELNQQDAVLKAAEALVSLPVNLDVIEFVMRPDGARLTAAATGRSATDALGKNLKPVPVNLVVEFVTETGTVVGSQEVAVPALEPGAPHQIRAEVKGQGIQGWRYKRK